MLACSEGVFAACSQPATATFQNTTNTITNFSYSQNFSASAAKAMLDNCNPAVRINSYFNAKSGSTDLTGASPFGIAPTVTINGSQADAGTLNDAKAWLANNFNIAFNLRDKSKGKPAKSILSLDTNYNILPETGDGNPQNNTSGVPFYMGARGAGTKNADTITENLQINFTNTSKPSAAIIAALNGATIRIHLGTYYYKYGPYYTPYANTETSGSLELYQDLTLHFSFPTCTMADQRVNLATVPTSVLNSSQTANAQSFDVTINCSAAIPSSLLVATFMDSFSPSNVNSNGILKNQPTLANRSNVDVQLRDESNIPLEIGSQKSFYSVPAGSTATQFSKKLKAQYFRSAPTATPGYVHANTTVFLDYQ